MDRIAPEPPRPGPSYPAEGLRARPNVDRRRIEFADLVGDQAPRPSTQRPQPARSHESNESRRADRESDAARHRRQAAAADESRSKATNDREPKSPDRAHPEETRAVDDQRVESDRDIGEPAGTRDEKKAATPGDDAGTGQSSAASSHLPRREAFAETLFAESGLAQTGAGTADPDDPDSPDAATFLPGGSERRAGLVVIPGSTGKEPAARAGELAADLAPIPKPVLAKKPADEAGGPANSLAAPPKGKSGGTLLTAEQAAAEEGPPPQAQGALPKAASLPTGHPAGAAHAGAGNHTFAQGDPLPHTLADHSLPQQSQVSGLAAAEQPTAQESALARNENPALSAAGALMPGARGATATASAASGPNTPSATVPLEKLGVEIAGHAQAGRQRFDIRLDPPELGHVHVRLDVDRDGHVTSRLVVDRAETLDLLRRDAPQLERALQDAGLKTDSQTMQFLLRDQGGQQQARQDSSGRSESPGAAERNAQADDAATDDRRNLSRLGGLDIRV